MTGTDSAGANRTYAAGLGLGRVGAAIAAGILIVLLVGLVLLVGRRGDADSASAAPAVPSAPSLPVGQPREVDAAALRAYAATTPGVYWAGELPGLRLELTRAAEGRTYVRYLPAGVLPGDRRPDFTTVATYPVPSAYDTVVRLGQQPQHESAPAPAGGLLAWSTERPTSAYLAYPGYDYLVEVYDPDGARVRELVLSSSVRPVR